MERHGDISFYLMGMENWHDTGCIHFALSCGIICLDVPLTRGIIREDGTMDTYRIVSRLGHTDFHAIYIHADDYFICHRCDNFILTMRDIVVLDTAYRLEGFKGISGFLKSLGFQELERSVWESLIPYG